jgi:hypothetical protein
VGIDKMSANHKRTAEPLVNIATAPNEPIAFMWQEILEEEGIHSTLRTSDLTASMYAPSGLFQCKVYVLASQAEKAKNILLPLIDGKEGSSD